MKKIKLLNVFVNNLSQEELLEQIEEGVVFTPNVDHLIKLQSDREFLHVYGLADYKLCDSQILLYASRFLGSPIKEKVSGSDFFPAFYKYHKHNQDIKIFLLGSEQGVARKAGENINKKVKRNIVVGSYSPLFGFETTEKESMKIVEMINQSGATVLAIGVGAPKQEKWIYKYRHKMPNIKIFLAIGATINFEAGDLQRAPKWMSNIGLEWLHRLLSEPKRLWKRYLIQGLPFFCLILKQKFNLYKSVNSQKPLYKLEEAIVETRGFKETKASQSDQSLEIISEAKNSNSLKRNNLSRAMSWLKPTSSINLLGMNSSNAKLRQNRKPRPKSSAR